MQETDEMSVFLWLASEGRCVEQGGNNEWEALDGDNNERNE